MRGRRTRRFRHLLLEHLEARTLLATAPWVSGVMPTGGAGHPFDALEIRFSEGVQDGTFDLADMAFTGPAGAIEPHGVTKLADDRYQLDLAGLTGLNTYQLVIGTEILDGDSNPLDQNRNGTPGEADDSYAASLFSNGASIAGDTTTYDGQAMVFYGGTSTIDGLHAFADVQLLGGATLTHPAATYRDEYRLELVIADSLLIDATSSIDVSGRGYLSEYTQGNVYEGGARNSAGGSYGGQGTLGSAAGSRTNDLYGDPLNPTEPGGGSGDRTWWPGGEGGGVVLISAGQVTVDGAIRADGVPGLSSTGGGGGAGGSVRINAGTLAGSGTISADGGDGSTGAGGDHGSGGGGRVAVYISDAMPLPVANVTAGGGTGPTGAGGAGSVEFPTQPLYRWDRPDDAIWHGIERLQWTGLGLDWAETTVRIEAQSGLDSYIVADALPPVGFFDWDTGAVPDGYYEVRATFLDAGGNSLHVFRFQNVLINNSVAWHEGTIRTNETWAADRVHAIEKPATVAAGATVTIEPGTVVKFAPGTGLSVAGGGRLIMPATAAEPIVFTLLTDDTLGGDTNLDGSLSRPFPGQSRGIEVDIEGQANLNEYVQQRYIPLGHVGTVNQDQVWSGWQLHHVTGEVIVASGATLTIEPGAVVKMGEDAGIVVQGGGRLLAPGTVAQPITFTSIHDDTVGGDTGADGNTTAPAPGDWHGIQVSGEAVLDHLVVAYAGGTTLGTWDAYAGAISTGGGAVVALSNSVIRSPFFEGILAGGGHVTVNNSIITGADRAVDSHTGAVVRLTHCTLDDNRIGIWAHGGTLDIANTIISNSLQVGIDKVFTTSQLQLRYSNVWSSTGVNYAHCPDQTGIDGNISADPEYRDRSGADYQLDYRSPAIDAADGVRATDADLLGAPRYDDPRTANTGVATAGGAFADMGVFEFVETADSEVDLVVSSVSGPLDAVVGNTAAVQWVVINRGNGVVRGPWHDRVALIGNPEFTDSPLVAQEVLVGQGVTLGPGEATTFTAEVPVPPAVEGLYHWLVKTNSCGEVFEGRRSDNNVQASLGTTVVSVPELSLDDAIQLGMFDWPGQVRLFKVGPGAGKDVRLSLELAESAGVTELYVGREYVPTPQQYDFRASQFGSADTSVVIPSTTDHTYYGAAVLMSAPVTPAQYRISAGTVSFDLFEVRPTKVGNWAPVTLELFGAGFTPDTTFTLRDTAGHESTAFRTHVSDSGHALATFDPGDFAGTIDVLANDTVFSGGLTTIAFDSGERRLNASVTGPESARAGRPVTYDVTVWNDGLVDAPIPLIKFEAPGAASTKIYDSTVNWGDKVTFLGINPRQPWYSLRPGEHFTHEITVTPSPGKKFLDAQVSVVPGEVAATDPTPMNWSSLPKPADVADADWQAGIAGLSDLFGDTLGEYYSFLIDQLDTIIESNLGHEYVGNLNGEWVLGPEPHGVPSAPNLHPVNNPQPPLPPGTPPTPKRDGIHKTYFVVILDADYSGTGLSDLPPIERDYKDLREYLKALGVPASQVVWRYDAVGSKDDAANRVNRQSVVDAYDSLKGIIDQDDTLVTIVSAHGSMDAAGNGFVDLHGDSMGAGDFTTKINELAPATAYFINLACRSQALTEGIAPNSPFVGISSSAKTQVTVSGNSGSLLLSQLKENLGLGYGLDKAFEMADKAVTDYVAKKKKVATSIGERLLGLEAIDWTQPKYWMDPQLYNPNHVDLSGNPWEAPTGYMYGYQVKRVYRAMPGNVTDSGRTWIYGSWDPNDKIGPAGAGPEMFIQAEEILPYTIHFENQATANAPAQEVVVTDTLDADLDWSTFELTGIGFNDVAIDDIPAGLQQYTAEVTVGSDPNPVDVTVSFEAKTGKITWRMRSRDPVTGGLPEDPIAGFLPPNDAISRGEGYVSFTVRPRAGLPTGTQITNRATIVFDPEYQANPPIDTPEVLHTLDADAPESQMAPLAAQSAHHFWISWAGEDEAGAGSGVAGYDVYVSDDGGPYMRWLENTTDATGVFTGQLNHTYRFYSVAADNVGHHEAAPATPDAETQVTRINWQNPWNRWDVDHDHGVHPADALDLINRINAHPGDSSLPAPPAVPPLYYDVNNDGFCTAGDVLDVINWINSHPIVGGEAEAVGHATGDLSAAALSDAVWIIPAWEVAESGWRGSLAATVTGWPDFATRADALWTRYAIRSGTATHDGTIVRQPTDIAARSRNSICPNCSLHLRDTEVDQALGDFDQLIGPLMSGIAPLVFPPLLFR